MKLNNNIYFDDMYLMYIINVLVVYSFTEEISIINHSFSGENNLFMVLQ